MILDFFIIDIISIHEVVIELPAFHRGKSCL